MWFLSVFRQLPRKLLLLGPALAVLVIPLTALAQIADPCTNCRNTCVDARESCKANVCQGNGGSHSTASACFDVKNYAGYVQGLQACENREGTCWDQCARAVANCGGSARPISEVPSFGGEFWCGGNCSGDTRLIQSGANVTCINLINNNVAHGTITGPRTFDGCWGLHAEFYPGLATIDWGNGSYWHRK